MSDIVKSTAEALQLCNVSRRYCGYWYILYAMELLDEDETRLTAITKEIYMEIAHDSCNSWKSVERDIRTVTKKAWDNNPEYIRKISGYPIRSAPCTSEFLSILLSYSHQESFIVPM